MKNNVLLFLIFYFLLSTFYACNTTEPPDQNKQKERQWEKIAGFDGMDVKGFEILNGELYVYGYGDNNGLYKTSDGVSWTKINLPDTGNFEYGVSAIAMKEEKLVVAPAYSLTKELCYIDSKGKVEIIPAKIPINISDIEILGDYIVIASKGYPDYHIGFLKLDGSLKLIADSIYTNPYVENECYKTNGIAPSFVSKLIKINNITDYLLGGELQAYHFIDKIDTTGFNCFSTNGLSTDDKFGGVYDLAWREDTLFAATLGYIKFFINGVWKVYKDTLPEPHGTVPFVTSFTFSNDIVYAATPSDGVLAWKNNKWNSMGDGLPRNKEQQIYPGISFIINFKDNLFIGFGTEKVLDSGMRGVWKYSLNK